MSPASSSNVLGAAFALVAVALGGCARGVEQNPVAAREAAHVGYVRMDDLVKRHPLYGELSRLEDDMAALQLRNQAGTVVAVAPADLERERRALQADLDAASARARRLLEEKQDDYSKREAAAVAAALAAAGVSASGGGIAGATQQQAQAQAQAVSAAAQGNLDRYRRDVIAQNRAALVALQKSLDTQAARTYRTQSETLSIRESDYALQLANDDKATRLSLRAKLSNLVLDDAARDDARKQLDGLERKETDALAAMKNRDAATLVALQTQLRAQTRSELDWQAAQMNRATLAKIDARELVARKEVAGQLGALPPLAPAGGGAAVPANLSPDMRAKLEALHKEYQADFDRDAKVTVDEFQRTRTELTQRFARLQGVDLAAQTSSSKELATLQKQHDQLYDQMVAQIGREVKLVAARRGVDVVLGDVLAPVGGVDLTADAEKDIESLHE